MKRKLIITGSLLTALIVLLAIIGYTIHSRNVREFERLQALDAEKTEAERIKNEKRMREQQAEMEKAEKDKQIWEKVLKLKEQTLKNKAGYADAVEKIKHIKDELKGSKYESMADEEINSLESEKKQAIDKIIEELTKEADEAISKNDYPKAISILSDYNGPMTEDSRDERLKVAQKFQQEVEDKAGKKKQEIEEKRKTFISAAAALILDGKFEDAMKLYKDSEKEFSEDDRKAMKEAGDIIGKLQGADDAILETCKEDIGKTVSVISGKSEKTMEITKVKDTSLYVKNPQEKVAIETKILVSDFSPAEKIKRAQKSGKIPLEIYSAIVNRSAKKYDDALKNLEGGGIFSEQMTEIINGQKNAQEEKMGPEHKAPVIAKDKIDDKTREFVIHPQHLTIEISSDIKMEASKNGESDLEKTERIKTLVKITNTAPIVFKDYSATILVLGENVAEKNKGTVLNMETKELTIKNRTTFEVTVETSNDFNKMGSRKFGCEHLGTIILIKDKKGKIFATEASKPTLAKIAEKFGNYTTDTVFVLKTGEEFKEKEEKPKAKK